MLQLIRATNMQTKHRWGRYVMPVWEGRGRGKGATRKVHFMKWQQQLPKRTSIYQI